MNKYKIGDVVKYTYDPGETDSGWFLAKIVQIRDGEYIADLIDKGQKTPYATDTFTGIHLGPDSASLELHAEKGPEPRVEFPELIGRAPVPAPEPDFMAPFTAGDSAQVRDANGKVVVYVDCTLSYSDDKKMAQVIAAALTAYFGED